MGCEEIKDHLFVHLSEGRLQQLRINRHIYLEISEDK